MARLASERLSDAAGAPVEVQPVLVVLDAEGAEVARLFGFVSERDLRAALDGVLE